MEKESKNTSFSRNTTSGNGRRSNTQSWATRKPESRNDRTMIKHAYKAALVVELRVVLILYRKEHFMGWETLLRDSLGGGRDYLYGKGTGETFISNHRLTKIFSHK